MKLLIPILLLVACTTTYKKASNQSPELIWDVIENAPSQRWSDTQLIQKIGKPNQVFKRPTKGIFLGWTYKNEASGFQEWGISFYDDMTVESVTYLPQEIHRHEFTIEKIMTRWKHLNCTHKKNKVLNPGLIRIESYIECGSDKRVAKYNKYNEIESILVKR